MGFNISKKNGPMSEINVTPLVDVMLVLLVIFMVTTPLMLNGIKLDLPKTKEVNKINLTSEQIILSITRSGEFFIGESKFLKSELIGELTSRLTKTKNQVLYLRADYEIKYGNVAQVMSYLKKSGIVKVALVTEIEKNKKL